MTTDQQAARLKTTEPFVDGRRQTIQIRATALEKRTFDQLERTKAQAEADWRLCVDLLADGADIDIDSVEYVAQGAGITAAALMADVSSSRTRQARSETRTTTFMATLPQHC